MENINTKERLIRFDNMESYSSACIYGSHLYFIEADRINLHYLDLETGDNAIFHIGKSYKKNNEIWSLFIKGYTELNGELFVTDGTRTIYRINLTTKNIKKIDANSCLDIVNKQLFTTGYAGLYTSGDRIFAVREEVNDSFTDITFSLVELIVTDDAITDKEMKQ